MSKRTAPASDLARAQLEFASATTKKTQVGTPRRVFRVGQVVALASRQLEDRFGQVWVEGESSNVCRPLSGHLYFTLKDQSARLSVVMFRSTAQALDFEMQDGMKLLCRGYLSIYPTQGRFQLTANLARPAGVGAAQLRLQQLKQRLAGEGLFRDEHKQGLPPFPRRIVIVTSISGAALHDVRRVLSQRFPVRLLICPAMVQGPDAISELVGGIQRADLSDADLIIVGRGGGSAEDLAAFNDERVARAVFAAKTPIISAVGHEVDLALTDLVADVRAPTPSAAAEMAVPVMEEVQAGLDALGSRLVRATRQGLRAQSLTLERCRRKLLAPERTISRYQTAVQRNQHRLLSAIRDALQRYQVSIHDCTARLQRHEPQKRLSDNRQRLLQLIARLKLAFNERVHEQRERFGQLVGQLDGLSPLGVLARGYSLAYTMQGNLLTDAAQVQTGQALHLRLHRGELDCLVTKSADPAKS